MAILILKTKFDPPKHVDTTGYWYRIGYGRYKSSYIDNELLDELEKHSELYERGIFPGIGLYIENYEYLYPCFLKISYIAKLKRYVYELKEDIYIYYIWFDGNIIPVHSREFINILRELGLYKDKLFYRISIDDWNNIKRKLREKHIVVYEPTWWSELLARTRSY